MRTIDTTITASVMLLFLGILIALLFGSVQLTSPNAISQIVSSQLAFGLMILSSSFRLFSFDHLVRERESVGGVSAKAMYMGKLCASLFFMYLMPLAYVCGSHALISSHSPFIEYFGLYLLLALAISGLANFLAVAFTVRHYMLNLVR